MFLGRSQLNPWGEGRIERDSHLAFHWRRAEGGVNCSASPSSLLDRLVQLKSLRRGGARVSAGRVTCQRSRNDRAWPENAACRSLTVAQIHAPKTPIQTSILSFSIGVMSVVCVTGLTSSF